ncbi:MAG: hypothetical protein IT302_08655 [Dehalococcoidia bacterium]|nr:hypothetical protein [Dehalococcoidia bacterium]
MKRSFLVQCLTAVVTVTILTLACGDDDTGSETSPTAENGTGVAAVDDVISVVERQDRPGLRSLVQLSSIACTTEVGAGGPPKCLTGEASGTMVQAFAYYTCSIEWKRDAEVDAALNAFWELSPELYAAFKPPTEYLLDGDYIVVFEGPDPRAEGREKRGAAVAIDDRGKVHGLWLACGAGDDGATLVPDNVSSYLIAP